MTIECVTFVDAAVAQMALQEFIDRHVEVFWLDRPREVRERMLSDAYDLIQGEGAGR